MNKIGIIGGGCYGTALAACFSRVAKEVYVVEKNQSIITAVNTDHVNSISLPNITLNKNIVYTNNVDDISDVDILFIVTPTSYISSVCEDIKAFRMPLVICSKGFDLENNQLTINLVENLLPNELFVLSGPSFASEIAQNLPAKVNLAGKDMQRCRELAMQLSSKYFKLEPISDMMGLQVAGALKNVLAIGCGILYGRNLGQSASAQFIVDGIHEMEKIAESFGGDAHTFTQIGALGDIILTCTSLQSRNMSFGKFLATGGSLTIWNGPLAEGIFAAKFIPNIKYSGKIFMGIYQVIYGLISVDTFLDSVLG